MLPARLASRIQRLQKLPSVVASNPNVKAIYDNYIHSLSTLIPYQQRQITTLEEEKQFADVLSNLVRTHSNTIPLLARGFLECKKYVDQTEVTQFLDAHLRARIGTRLVAEQHLALHFASQSNSADNGSIPANYIGVIDTALQPARIIKTCADYVGEICELVYGIRPRLNIGGQTDASFAYIPMHVEYIITELLKNSFRAVIESGNESEPIEVTIVAAPDVPGNPVVESVDKAADVNSSKSDADIGFEIKPTDVTTESANTSSSLHYSTPSSQKITIRIQDRGGGIPPEILSHIWSYSFTTFSNEVDDDYVDPLLDETPAGIALSGIAGLGYGLPLSRAYAEYFGGGIDVQSLWGWGTDVYLTLQGVGKIE